jgi:hypothetical protein
MFLSSAKMLQRLWVLSEQRGFNIWQRGSLVLAERAQKYVNSAALN